MNSKKHVKGYYIFNDAECMIDLARYLQTQVYWSIIFSLEREDEDDTELIPAKSIWELVVLEKEEHNAVALEIDDTDHIIKFKYK